MKKQIIFFLFIASVCAFIGISTIMPARTQLIPRSVLFGTPTKALARISPDGKYLSYLAPLNKDSKVLNIWIKSIDAQDDRPLTAVTDRSIQSYFWAPDNTQVLYLQDTNGDENWRLYGVNIKDKQIRCYTPYQGVKTEIIEYNKWHPHTMLIGINKNNPEVHDVHELNLISGELKLVVKNPGNIATWLADRNLVIRGALIPTDEGGQKLLVRKDNNSPWQTVREWNHEDSTSSSPLGFSYNGDALYLSDSKDANTARLLKMDLATKNIEVLAEDPQYDVHSVHFNPDTYEAEAVSFMKDYEEWKILSPSFGQLFNVFTTLGNGNLYIMSVDNEQRKWIVCLEQDQKPASYYLYDTKLNKMTHLFDSRPELSAYTLTTSKPITYTSRDGLSIHGYLSCPPSSDCKNLPLILLVHGGPWARDTWGYRPEAQWLANRGYAVLQVNYRGSTGYGKKFINAGNKEWAGKMHNDLVDAIEWAVKQGIANPKKVAIYGGSYGGYAALVGATFTPDLLCCAVDIVGPSNLLTLLHSMPPYWKPMIKQFYQAVGNPEKDTEFLKERSPLFKAQNIKIPLLIAQGAQDPRVKQAESEQIVAALKEHGIPHEYLLFEDEGHGFLKYENKQKFYAAAEKFLAQHMGGKYEV
jgi:dipeptidyl aminopeptidase/acylaminoacyl peptidase